MAESKVWMSMYLVWANEACWELARSPLGPSPFEYAAASASVSASR
jgi:acyl-CoA thioesterase FadM